MCRPDGSTSYMLTMALTLQGGPREVFEFAYTFPYTYTHLQHVLHTIQPLPSTSDSTLAPFLVADSTAASPKAESRSASGWCGSPPSGSLEPSTGASLVLCAYQNRAEQTGSDTVTSKGRDTEAGEACSAPHFAGSLGDRLWTHATDDTGVQATDTARSTCSSSGEAPSTTDRSLGHEGFTRASSSRDRSNRSGSMSEQLIFSADGSIAASAAAAAELGGFIRRELLCRTPQGRRVDVLTIAQPMPDLPAALSAEDMLLHQQQAQCSGGAGGLPMASDDCFADQRCCSTWLVCLFSGLGVLDGRCTWTSFVRTWFRTLCSGAPHMATGSFC